MKRLKIMIAVLLCAITVLSILITGCKEKKVEEPAIVPIDINTGRLIQHEGVKYYVPMEAGSHSDAPGEFRFECEGLRLIVSKKQIYVNGKKYGSVKEGDVVSFLNKGYVFVNGQLRKPVE
ncbi:MAG: hypothetical protein ACP5MG_06110 [Verrucomicrobiia bacterium]|jgi:hypothetical protein